MKHLNKKGFTLIELLAVIVVLAIILVITVPMVLNSISQTRKEALQASADSSVRFYNDQLGMVFLGVNRSGFVVDARLNSSTGKLYSQGERCITKEEADILGLNTTDYSINESCTGTTSLPSSCANTANYSTVSWDSNGMATVKLVGKSDKFMNGSTPLIATSSKSVGGSSLTNFALQENPVLTGTTSGNTIQNLKIYGNTVDGVSVGTQNGSSYNITITSSGKNLIEYPYAGASTAEWNINDNGSIDVNVDTGSGVYKSLHLKRNDVLKKGTYSFSCGNDSVRLIIYFLKADGTDGYHGITNNGTITLTNDVSYVRMYLQINPNSSVHQTIYPMLEQSSGVTEFIPYEAPKTYTINLDAPLRSNGDVRDYIDFEQGKIVRWIDGSGSVLITPTEQVISLPSIQTMNNTTILFANTTISPLFTGSY